MANETDHPNHPDNLAGSQDDRTLTRAQTVIGPTDSLAEPTLAVDLATAEIDRLIATAHRFPRKLDVVREQLTQMALMDEASAENSVYALPRGGKPIVGPSIGFANAAAMAWGNCWDDGHWLHTDRREKVVVGRGVFIDFQTNRRTTITEQRRIVNARGHLFSDDMIIVTSKAASSIARRNAILAGVPRPIWFPIYERALYIVRGTEATLPERREKALKALMNYGINPKQVFLYLGVKDDKEIGVEHIPTLRGMFTQLRDGSVTPEEMFDPRKMMGRGFETVDNPLADAEDEEAAGGQGGQQQGGQAQPGAGGAGTTGGTPAAGAKVEPEGDGGDEVIQEEETQAGAKAAGEGAQAPAAGAAQASPAKPAAASEAAREPAKPAAAAAPEKPAAKPAKAAAAAPEDTGPKASEEYEAHVFGWLDAADERSWPSVNIDETWKGERKMRERCMVVEDAFERCRKRYMEVLTAAKAREKK